MTLLRDIAQELLGMFLADARLSGTILLLVAIVAYLVDGDGLDPLIGGAVLIAGCLAILATVTAAEARRRGRD